MTFISSSYLRCASSFFYRSQENFLTIFPHELTSNMPRLHHLNLSHNRLDEFSDETFAKNEELVSLDIAYNNLKTFTELTFKGLEVLEVCALNL